MAADCPDCKRARAAVDTAFVGVVDGASIAARSAAYAATDAAWATYQAHLATHGGDAQ